MQAVNQIRWVCVASGLSSERPRPPTPPLALGRKSEQPSPEARRDGGLSQITAKRGPQVGGGRFLQGPGPGCPDPRAGGSCSWMLLARAAEWPHTGQLRQPHSHLGTGGVLGAEGLSPAQCSPPHKHRPCPPPG